MKKAIIITVCVVGLAIFGLAIAGTTGWDGPHRSPEEKISYLKFKITEKLKLNADQQTTLDRIAEEILAQKEQRADDRKAFKSELMTTLRQEHVDAQELETLFETKKPAIDTMVQKAAGYIAEFHSVLTPEQRETMVAEMEAHQGRRCRLFR